MSAPEKSRKPRFDLACSPGIRGQQKEWYADLRRKVVEENQPFVLTEALTPHEIFEAFDMPFVTNEWWSGVVASNRQAGYYFGKLEEAGYSKRLERYGAVALAEALDDGANPDIVWGGLPRPSLIVHAMTDPTRTEMSERTATVFDTRRFELTMPQTGLPMPARWWDTSRRGWEQLGPSWQLDYSTQLFWRLIHEVEDLTGRKLDIDRLREIVEMTNQQNQMFEDVRDVIISAPKTPISLPEMLGDVMALQWQRGTPWALEQATRFRDEIRERAANEQWICPNEQYRFAWMGAGLWQNTGFYRMFEESHGVVFVQSMYMSLGVDGYRRFGPDVVRGLASRYSAFGLYTADWQAHEALTHRCDGVITIASNLNGIMRSAFERVGIPVLALDLDQLDGRSWDENAVRDAMSRFIEEEIEPRRRARG